MSGLRCGIGNIEQKGSPGIAILFTSDSHFGQGGALGLFRRPFASVAEMDAALILRWNDAVRPDDVVWHLGDLAIRQKPIRIAAVLAALNGIKHLVSGNNDTADTVDQPAWASVQSYAEITVDERLLVLCHYPFRTWRDMNRGAVNLHGHSHGGLAGLTRQWDVGVDVWDFRPVDLATVLARKRVRK